MSDRRCRRVALVLAAALLAVMVPALALAKIGTPPPPKPTPTPPSAMSSKPPKPGGPAIGFVSPSPAAGAVLTSGDAAFAFTVNRKPKQTKSVTCALVGPTTSSGPCTAPVAVAGGSSSSKAYSGLANGDYTITVTVVLSDGNAVSASRQFKVSVVSCTSGLSASVPVQDGARDGQTFYGNPPPDPSSVWWWGLPVPPGLTAVVSRGHDIELDASLTGGCADAAAWTYSWSYRLGDDTQAGVPGGWTGATAASLAVPKWSLRFSDETHKDYTFTVTATPPAGSSQQPLIASVMLRVGSFLADRPKAGFAPTGFSAPLVPDGYTYRALGQNPFSFSVDSPPDQQDQIGYTWYAEVFGHDEIPPDFGQGTPTAHYTWTSLETFLIKLTVCSANAPDSPTNPCTTTNDFIFSTTAGNTVEGIRLSGNRVFSNANLEIDLGETNGTNNGLLYGVTANDTDDPDDGANRFQNFPVLTSALSNGVEVVIQFALNSEPSKTYTLEFFHTATCDVSGHGGAELFLGGDDFATDGSGDLADQAILPLATKTGFITATATNVDNGTSEFSECLAVTDDLDFKGSFEDLP